MKKYLIFALFLIIILIAFYSVYPKYRFHFNDTLCRTNIITGKVEMFSIKSRKWINLTDNLPKSNNSERLKWADIAATDKYKIASPELKTQIQNKYFDDFVKTAPGYRSDWEWEIRTKLFGEDTNNK